MFCIKFELAILTLTLEVCGVKKKIADSEKFSYLFHIEIKLSCKVIWSAIKLNSIVNNAEIVIDEEERSSDSPLQ